MVRTVLLIFCILLFGGCTPATAPQTAAAASHYLFDKTLRTHTVTLRFPDGVEVVSLAELGFSHKNGAFRADEDMLFRYAEAVSKAYRLEATDATVTLTDDLENPFVYTEASDGTEPDPDALYALLLAVDPNRTDTVLTVPYRTVPAVITTDALKESHTLVSEYTTSYAEKALRKENRVHNIMLAAERIHGATVQPDEVFSVNRAIGDRTKANGYKLAGAINNGASVTEYGGGVCQVSTTLFNAVLMADLEVVERYHHSWPMEYAPIGRDATIATGQKDFRFRNTTDAPVTILAFADQTNKTVTVRLYGKRSTAFDRIEIVSEQLSRLPSKPAEYILDESLPPGTKEVERQGRRGRTSVTYLNYYDANGNLLRRVTAFEDTYPSIGEIAYLSPDLYYGTEESE